jgi:hypothetical protein
MMQQIDKTFLMKLQVDEITSQSNIKWITVVLSI